MPNSDSDREKFSVDLARYVSGANPKGSLSPTQAAEGAHLCFVNTNELLFDARILAVEGRVSRALSLTVLALEELAKISELHRVAIKCQFAPDQINWKEFWGDFNFHKPKQKRATAYGNAIKEAVPSTGDGLDNPLPYKSYFSEKTFGNLDRAKQKNFYVDFLDGKFVAPVNDKKTREILSVLYAFASERIDTFGSWHSSIARNLAFDEATAGQVRVMLESGASAQSGLVTFNGWANTFTSEELRADVLRLACYRSSGGVPDYSQFVPQMEVVNGFTKENREAVLADLARELQARIACHEVLPQFAHRAFCMFKLLIGYADKHLTKQEFKNVFSKIANAV